MPTANAISAFPTSRPSSAPGVRAEFFLCLARAFLPPVEGATRAAFAHALPDDLAELAEEAGYGIAPLLRRFALAAGEAEAQLLEGYSALFLVPPVLVPLNAGLYLDGGLLGRSTQGMLERYGEAGLAPDENFHDLPDHVVMQLEYVSVMFARAAEGDPELAESARAFLAEIVLRWVPVFAQALEAAAPRLPAAGAYAALARILEAAARHEAG